MKKDSIVLAFAGLGFSGICIYLIYCIVQLLVTGLAEESLFLLVGGGILAYLFVGVLALGFIVGLFLIFIAIAD